jgi:hypothetical protein
MADARLSSPPEPSGQESACVGYETTMAASEQLAEDQPVFTEPQAVAAE